MFCFVLPVFSNGLPGFTAFTVQSHAELPGEVREPHGGGAGGDGAQAPGTRQAQEGRATRGGVGWDGL